MDSQSVVYTDGHVDVQIQAVLAVVPTHPEESVRGRWELDTVRGELGGVPDVRPRILGPLGGRPAEISDRRLGERHPQECIVRPVCGWAKVMKVKIGSLNLKMIFQVNKWLVGTPYGPVTNNIAYV